MVQQCETKFDSDIHFFPTHLDQSPPWYRYSTVPYRTGIFNSQNFRKYKDSYSYSGIRLTRRLEYVTRRYVTRRFRGNMRFLKTKTAKKSKQTLRKYSEAEHWYDSKIFCDKNNIFENPILKKI